MENNATYTFKSTWEPLARRPPNLPPLALIVLPHLLLILAIVLPPPTSTPIPKKNDKTQSSTSRTKAVAVPFFNYRTALILPIIIAVNTSLIVGFGVPPKDHPVMVGGLDITRFFKGYHTGVPVLNMMSGYQAFWFTMKAIDILGIVRVPELVHYRVGRYASQTPNSGGLFGKLGWALSLIYAFRGIGWEWGQRGYIPPRDFEAVPPEKGRTRAWLIHRLKRFVFIYLVIDLAGFWLRRRPYFQSAGRAPGAESLNSERRFFIWALDVVAAAGSGVALELQYIQFSVAMVLLGKLWYIIRKGFGMTTPQEDISEKEYDPEDDWPEFYGSLWEGYSICRAFSVVWHSLMRRPFLSIPRPFIQSLGLSLGLERQLRRLGGFILSGIFHASGGWVVNNKGMGSLMWFAVVVPLGLCIEAIADKAFRTFASPKLLEETFPEGRKAALWVRMIGLAWMLSYLLGTVYLMFDEFVQGGLFEDPLIPISIVSGLTTGQWIAR